MRILILRRQNAGSQKSLPDALCKELDKEGIEVVVDDADWIPNATGHNIDREISKLVKQAVQGFDVIHAWGYRAAWACSQALYLHRPWIYTAYDIPKTTHSEFIDRLNAAHRGLCSSMTVRQVLDQADTLNLEVITPGVIVPERFETEIPTKEEARATLGLPVDQQIVFSAARNLPQRCLHEVVNLAPAVNSLVVVAGWGDPIIFEEKLNLKVLGYLDDLWLYILSADLVIVPSNEAGFSLFGAESMWMGTPVLFKKSGGLIDMAEEGMNGFFYEEGQLVQRVNEVLQLELTRESAARSGQLRAQGRYKFSRFASDISRIYREIAGD